MSVVDWLEGYYHPQIVVVEHPRLTASLQQSLGLQSICPLWQSVQSGLRLREYENYATGDKIVRQSQVIYQQQLRMHEAAQNDPDLVVLASVNCIRPEPDDKLTKMMKSTDVVRDRYTTRRICLQDSANEEPPWGVGASLTKFMQMAKSEMQYRDLVALANGSAQIVDILAAGEPKSDVNVWSANTPLPLALAYVTLEGDTCLDELRELAVTEGTLPPMVSDANHHVGKYFVVVSIASEDENSELGAIKIGPKLCTTAQDATDALSHEFPSATCSRYFRIAASRKKTPFNPQCLPEWARQIVVRVPDAFFLMPVRRSSLVSLMASRPDDCRQSIIFLDEEDSGPATGQDEPMQAPLIPERVTIDHGCWLREHCYKVLIPERIDLYIKQISHQQANKKTSLLGFRNQLRSLVGNEPVRKASNQLGLHVLNRRLGECYMWTKSYLQALIAFKQGLSEMRSMKLRPSMYHYQECAAASIMVGVRNTKNGPVLIGDDTYLRDALTWLNEPLDEMARDNEVPVTQVIRHMLYCGRVMALLSVVHMLSHKIDNSLRSLEIATHNMAEALSMFGNHTRMTVITSLAGAAIALQLYLISSVASIFLNQRSVGAPTDKEGAKENVSLYQLLARLLGMDRPLFPSSLTKPLEATSEHQLLQLPRFIVHHKTAKQKCFFAFLALKNLQYLNQLFGCAEWQRLAQILLRCDAVIPTNGRGIGQYIADEDVYFDEPNSLIARVVAAIARRPALDSVPLHLLAAGQRFDFGLPILVSDNWMRTRGYVTAAKMAQSAHEIERIMPSSRKMYTFAIHVIGKRIKYSAIPFSSSEEARESDIAKHDIASVQRFDCLVAPALMGEAMALDRLSGMVAPRKKSKVATPTPVNGFEANQELRLRIALYNPLPMHLPVDRITLSGVREPFDNVTTYFEQRHKVIEEMDKTRQPEQFAGSKVMVTNFTLVKSFFKGVLAIYEGAIPKRDVTGGSVIRLLSLETVVSECTFTQSLTSHLTANQLRVMCADHSPQRRITRREFPPILIPSNVIDIRVISEARLYNQLYAGEIISARLTFRKRPERLYLAGSDMMISSTTPSLSWHSKIEATEFSTQQAIASGGEESYTSLLLHPLAKGSYNLRVAVEHEKQLFGRDIYGDVDAALQVRVTREAEDVLYTVSNLCSHVIDVYVWQAPRWLHLGVLGVGQWAGGCLSLALQVNHPADYTAVAALVASAAPPSPPTSLTLMWFVPGTTRFGVLYEKVTQASALSGG